MTDALNLNAIRSEIRPALINQKANACPMAARVAWHAAGTYDASDGSGGTDGATMRFEPERWMGSIASDSWMLVWLRHAKSTHSSGARRFIRWKALAHSLRTDQRCSPESDHEWEMKASHSPSSHADVNVCSPLVVGICAPASTKQSAERRGKPADRASANADHSDHNDHSARGDQAHASRPSSAGKKSS